MGQCLQGCSPPCAYGMVVHTLRGIIWRSRCRSSFTYRSDELDSRCKRFVLEDSQSTYQESITLFTWMITKLSNRCSLLTIVSLSRPELYRENDSKTTFKALCPGSKRHSAEQCYQGHVRCASHSAGCCSSDYHATKQYLVPELQVRSKFSSGTMPSAGIRMATVAVVGPGHDRHETHTQMLFINSWEPLLLSAVASGPVLLLDHFRKHIRRSRLRATVARR